MKQGELEFKKKTCLCNTGYFGDSCQYKGPCTELKFQDGESFPGYLSSFHLLYKDDGKPLFVHDRPAYIQRPEYMEYQVLLFDGGRWLVIGSVCLYDHNSTALGKSLIRQALTASQTPMLTRSNAKPGTDPSQRYMKTQIHKNLALCVLGFSWI